MRSLFAGVSALKNHQIRMDVIGNNIANVNTAGYKGSRVTFRDLMSQTLRDAAAPQGMRGGMNPMQVGLGAGLAAITVQHTQGNTETTGVETDLAIEGNGFFVLSNGNDQYYSRAGMFDIDDSGNLVSSVNGFRVMGWQADVSGNIDTRAALTPLTIPKGAAIDPASSTRITYAGNLDATQNGTLLYLESPVEINHPSGQNVRLSFAITPTGNFNEFRWNVATNTGALVGETSGILQLAPDGSVASVLDSNGNPLPAPGDIVLDLGGGEQMTIRPPQIGDANGGSFGWDLDNDGNIDDESLGDYTRPEARVTSITVYDSLGNPRDVITRFYKVGNNSWEWTAEDAAGNPLTVTGGVPGQPGTIVFGPTGGIISQTGQIELGPIGGGGTVRIEPDFSAVTQYAEDASVQAARQDGHPAGTLKSFGIDANGVINGSFSNGITMALGQVAIATFANPAGLKRTQDTMYEISSNSGMPRIGEAGTGENGVIRSGALEMSNVDLSSEFTNMIITQRGFQANSRIITASDEMLQELVNLKR